jgi:hypothetical protein
MAISHNISNAAAGYLVVDWARPSERETNRDTIELYKRHCYAVRRPAIVLRVRLKTCSITLDMDPMQRDRVVKMGGLTPAESAAIEKLMEPYRRELRGSPIIRRWGFIPGEFAHDLATSIFKIIMGEVA